MPRFFKKTIESTECQEGGKSYYTNSGPISTYRNPTALQVYMWMYFIFGILLPLIVLAYCNIYLVRTLKKAMNMRKTLVQSKNDKSSQTSKNIVTLTLSIIVVLFIFLVGPAEILTFWKSYIQKEYGFLVVIQYSMAVAVCNMLQAINFSINFVLYFVINVHFRKVVKDVLCCHRIRKGRANGTTVQLKRHRGGSETYSTMYTTDTAMPTAV